MTPAELKALDDRPSESVPVPEWNCEVRLRSVGVKIRNQLVSDFRRISAAGEDTGPIQVRLVAYSMAGQNGKALHEEIDGGIDALVEIINERNPDAIDRLAQKAADLAGISEKKGQT